MFTAVLEAVGATDQKHPCIYEYVFGVFTKKNLSEHITEYM